MAIDTTNKKFAMLHWGRIWEASLPLSPSTLGNDDKQQLLWGYPGVLWGAAASIVGNAILDLNTRLSVFLNTHYGYSPHKDANALAMRYLRDELTGDYANRFKQLVDDATL